MLIRMLAGNEAARANLAPKLIRAGLLLLCLWWVFTLLLAGQALGYSPPAILLEPRFLPTVLWIAIALLAWGLLRGSLTQTAPKALPLVLTVILCGQALHQAIDNLLPLYNIASLTKLTVWEWTVIGNVMAFLIGSRVAAVILFRRWPVIAIAIVMFHVFPAVVRFEDSAVEAMTAVAQEGTEISSADITPQPETTAEASMPKPSLALDLFSIALLYAYYRSRRAAPPQEAAAS